MYVIYVGVLLMMYNPMVQILRWKYQGRNETPFETQSFLIYTSIFAFLIACLTSAFSLHYYLTNSIRKSYLLCSTGSLTLCFPSRLLTILVGMVVQWWEGLDSGEDDSGVVVRMIVVRWWGWWWRVVVIGCLERGRKREKV
ncbi:hypothetical protein HanLR1_Chr00c0093g0708731 [Helianthus annuus]|nr:hypothetical protein HanLR1_Chr00c0093g0708731 [Helianthus annuus]